MAIIIPAPCRIKLKAGVYKYNYYTRTVSYRISQIA
jgi:hypothetical protein